MPYVGLGCFTLFLALLTAFIPLPVVLGNEPAVEGGADQGHAWSFRHLRLGAFAIFAYVGAEVAIGSIMINFLGQPSMGGYSHVSAATYVSYYWGAAMVGRETRLVVAALLQNRTSVGCSCPRPRLFLLRRRSSAMALLPCGPQ